MSGTILLRPGSWLSLDGEAVEVVSLEGATVTVRDAAGAWQAMGTATLLARACPLDACSGRRACQVLGSVALSVVTVRSVS